MGLYLDYRATHLKPIFFRIGFRDVQFDDNLQTYVPGVEYSGIQLKDYLFEAKITFHEISSMQPYGNYEPFLTMTAKEEDNVIILNSNEVSNVRIVASAEWRKPGDKFLSIWSTSMALNLKKANEFNINLIMDQVSIGREPLMAHILFNPVVDPALLVDRKVNLSLELIRTDVGKVTLPGSFKLSQKINLDESLLLELPRGQWFYTVRAVE